VRITSWNCQGGECRQRAARLDHLHADIIVLQECTKPDVPDHQCIWFETPGTKRGVGIVTSGEWRVEKGLIDAAVSHSVFPVRVSGPTPFHLLAIWALPKPTYSRAILYALDRYREFIEDAPAIAMGDFNSPANDARSSTAHATLEDRLRAEFSLVNAWHSYAERTAQPTNKPTHYWRRKQESEFHIDYCFFPADWSSKLQSAEIGNYSDWVTESDHCPLTVEFEEP
jgi:endonuclease/exonuclease/phosphatase family metal-dependent hydrolase